MQDLQVDETSSQKGPKLFAFAKKQKQKAEEKARMKAEKKERERSMSEANENRRRTTTEMDKAKLKEFLEAEINRLETENLVKKTLESDSDLLTLYIYIYTIPDSQVITCVYL